MPLYAVKCMLRSDVQSSPGSEDAGAKALRGVGAPPPPAGPPKREESMSPNGFAAWFRGGGIAK